MFEQLMMGGALTGAFLAFIIIISIWSLIWKGMALWKCGQNNQLAWFVIILIFNTAGILPIVYLLFFQPKAVKARKVPAKKKGVRRKKK